VSLNLKFCGAARMVTGSCFLLETGGCKFLVDCGLFQGTKTVKQLNYDPFPFDSQEIDFVLLTHAHIDHSGLLPKLFNGGFRGPVFMTAGTRDLLTFMLPDSGYIQEMEVRHLNERNAQRGKPAVEPIYTLQDAEDCQENFQPVEYDTWININNEVRARYWNAGHILGSASIELEIAANSTNGKLIRVLFSGDIGPDHKLFHPDPEAASDFDYVVCESTYGGRGRVRASGTKRRAMLVREVNKALDGGGMLVIPSFAVERSQELLADLSLLQQTGKIPPVPIFLDSPMAIRATRVFRDHADELEGLDEAPELLDNPNIHFTENVNESKAINRITNGAIIMAASGMCEAGRIRHHLKNHLWRARSTVLIVGYQTEGTLGRLLLDGKKTVRIQGQNIEVKARIRQIDTYSGHADNTELKEWMQERLPIRRGIFLVHGEEKQSLAMKKMLVEAGLDDGLMFIPSIDDQVELLTGQQEVHLKSFKPRLSPHDVSGLDWHNDLAQFQIDLREAFDRAADKRSRKALLRRLRRALDDA